MKKSVLFFIFWIIITEISYSQLIYPEIMEIIPGKITPVKQQGANRLFPYRLNRLYLKDRLIENPGVRYAVQNLKKERNQEQEVKEAINTLLNYAEDYRLKRLIQEIRNYTQATPAREQAMNILQNRITYDSVEFYANSEHLFSSDMDEYLNTDLQTLVSYIRNDSNYTWLQKISRDSTYIEVMSSVDNSVKFWINNGRNEYHRFWAANKLGDTIGTWIQVLPRGNNIRIYVDEDVYQTPKIITKEATEKPTIFNKPGKDFFIINKMREGKLHRRYWTYYSEVEFAMSQGKLANWANGGENSLSLLSNIRYFWNYNKNKTSWESWMHYRFGFMKNGDEDIRKNEDRFELNTKLGQKAFKHWYYTAQFNTLTQLFNSYEYKKNDKKEEERKLVANFMSPGYFTLSLGLDYKPNDNFSLFISPIAGKWNFVRDTAKIDEKRYGINEEGKRYRREAGAKIDLRSKLSNIFNIMDIRNEFTAFMSYEEKDRYLNKDKDDEERKKIPVQANWKLTLDFKINYFMRASIYTETIYDENYSRKLQFRENLNLGVNFRF